MTTTTTTTEAAASIKTTAQFVCECFFFFVSGWNQTNFSTMKKRNDKLSDSREMLIHDMHIHAETHAKGKIWLDELGECVYIVYLRYLVSVSKILTRSLLVCHCHSNACHIREWMSERTYAGSQKWFWLYSL